MNLQMDSLDNSLTTHPIQRGWQSSIELYWNYRFRYVDDLHSQFGNSHQQKKYPSGRNGSVRADTVRRSHQRHPGGGIPRARCTYSESHCISPSHRGFTVSCGSVGLLQYMNTLALWPTVTIRRNGFIGYALGSGLQCDG